MRGREELPIGQPSRDQPGKRGRAHQHVHHDDLQLHRLQRARPRQDHARHRARQLDQTDRLGRVDDRRHRADDRALELRQRRLPAGRAQRQLALDHVALVIEVVA